MKKIAVLGLVKVGRLASELMHDGSLQGSGFLKQEDIKLDAFLATRAGAIFAA